MRFLSCLFSLLLISSSHADLLDLSNSVCRIRNENGYGTGFCYKEDAENFYVLTAGHCLKDMTETGIDLYHSGASYRINGEVVRYIEVEYTSRDVGVVKIKKVDMNNYKDFTPLTFGLNYKPIPHSLVWSYGCPNGNWPNGFKGRWLENHYNFLRFTPCVHPGRSGSPVMDHYCDKVVGLVVMCNGQYAIAIKIDVVQDILTEWGLEQ